MSASDWTVDPETSTFNSSQKFLNLCAEVEQLIRDDAHKLIGGRADMTARSVMAQLAHKHDVGPLAAARSEGWAQAVEALRELAKVERRDAATYPPGSPGRLTCLHYAVGIERAIRGLADRAAALTEETNRG